MDRKAHWQSVYTTKAPDSVSWFQPTPTVSIQLLDAAGLTPDTWVLDVGGGDSRLVDYLVNRQVACLSVLDISVTALARAQARLGPAHTRVAWIEADVTDDWPVPSVDIWHDRAVFHFLTELQDRERYRAHARASLRPGGSIIMATFGPDGPQMCSGLPAVRYSPEALAREFGSDYRMQETVREVHPTPFGTTQEFWYSRLTRSAWTRLLLYAFQSCARVRLKRNNRLSQLEYFLELVGLEVG